MLSVKIIFDIINLIFHQQVTFMTLSIFFFQRYETIHIEQKFNLFKL